VVFIRYVLRVKTVFIIHWGSIVMIIAEARNPRGVRCLCARRIGLSAAIMMAAMHTVPALANVQVWNFDNSSHSFNNTNNGNSLKRASPWRWL
jgi:hypothetical protein